MFEHKNSCYGVRYLDMPILSMLANERILYIDTETRPGMVMITEGCDGYFSQDLDKEQFGKLIEELKLVYDQLN